VAIQTILNVKDGDTLGAVRGFLKLLLVEHVVDSLLVPLEVPSPDQVSPIIVREPKQLDTANPLAPVMRINAAAVVARVQREEGASRLGAVLRPCELRAVIELAKVERIDLEQLMLIGIDCMGTYEPDAYGQLARASADSPTDEMLKWTRQGPIAPYRLRNACQMCEQFTTEHADIAIGLIGLNVRERLLIQTDDPIAARLHLHEGDTEGRQKAIARLALIRRHRHEQALTQAAQWLRDLPSVIGLFASCTACGECIDACPFCGVDAFRPQPTKEPTDRLRDWPTNKDQTVRTRVSGPWSALIEWGRRAASCVGCGMCESACARHVPLTAIQGVIGRKVREEFKYVPGHQTDERLPWAIV
jgi:formate dehydrogenase subunit beta